MERKERATLKEREDSSAFPCLLIPSRMEVGSCFLRKHGRVGHISLCKLWGCWGVGWGVRLVPSLLPRQPGHWHRLIQSDVLTEGFWPGGWGARTSASRSESKVRSGAPPRSFGQPPADLQPCRVWRRRSPSAVHLPLPGLPLSPPSRFSHIPVHLWASTERPAFLACWS